MSTIATALWDHNEMSQDMVITLYDSNFSRSGSNVSFQLGASIYLGGSSSYWGYDAYAKFTVNGVTGPEFKIRDSSPSLTSGDTNSVDPSTVYSYSPGTSSGSIPVSVHIYSKNDTNSCGINGVTASGSISYAATNTAPSAPTSLSPTSGAYVSSIPVSWSGASDGEGDALVYDLEVSFNSGSTWNRIATDNSGTSFAYDISAHGEGTTYRFRVRAKDTSSAYSGWYTSSSDASKNYTPSAPTTLTPTSGVFDSSISVSWSGASDSDGQALTYDLDVSTNGGANWSNIKAASTTTSFAYDISAHGEGTTYRFRVRAKDTLGVYSAWKTNTTDAVKNSSPAAPTSVSPTSGIYDTSITVSWSGASDPNGQALTYDIEVSNNSGSTWTRISTDNAGTSFAYNISAHAQGTTYRFRVRSQDTMSYYSGWFTTTTNVSKNRSPNATSSVWTNESFAQTATTAKWNAATDPDGQAVTYNINIYKNGVLLTTATSSTTSYLYTWPGATACNDVFSFGIITEDSMGYTSGEIKGGSCTKKLPSTAPSLTVPVNASTVYDKRPRIVIKINSDPNGDNQKLYVTWKGVEYNSVDNATWFSSTGAAFVNTKVIVFEPQIDGVIGSNAISIRTYNGYYYSSATAISITIATIAATAITADVTNPKSNFITEIRTAINDVLQAYGGSAFTFITPVATSNFIGTAEITEMRGKLTTLINTLNGYDTTSTTFDKTSAFTEAGIFISSAYIDELKTKLNDL